MFSVQQTAVGVTFPVVISSSLSILLGGNAPVYTRPRKTLKGNGLLTLLKLNAILRAVFRSPELVLRCLAQLQCRVRPPRQGALHSDRALPTPSYLSSDKDQVRKIQDWKSLQLLLILPRGMRKALLEGSTISGRTASI